MVTTLLLIAALLLWPQGDAGPPSGEVSLTLDAGRPMRGDPEATVVVVEFSDFKCHACEKFSLTIMPNLEKEFIEPGKVKVTFVDFPLVDQDHYTTVAESVHCAGEQGKYWEMHDLLWQKIGRLADWHLVEYAGEMGLDVTAFTACLEQDRFRERILDDLQMAYGLGVSARPTFFIGRRDAGQGPNVYTGRYIVGAQNYLLYKSVIRRMLPDPEEE